MRRLLFGFLLVALALGASGHLFADQAISRTDPALTISTSAVNIPRALVRTPEGLNAKYCLGDLQGGQIRFWDVGAAPTSSEGRVMNPGQTIRIEGQDMFTWKGIRTGSTDGLLALECYR